MRKLKKLDFYSGWRGKLRLYRELQERIFATGNTISIHKGFFQSHNPCFDPSVAFKRMRRSYNTLFHYLDKSGPPESLLEVGCAFGLGTWILSDLCDNIVGVDIDTNRIDIASRVFPEVEFHSVDVSDFLNGRKFDVIVTVHAPYANLINKCNKLLVVAKRSSTFKKAGLEGGIQTRSLDNPIPQQQGGILPTIF